MSMLEVAVDPATVIVAVDAGKVLNRVWVSNGAGRLAAPLSLPVSREGVHVLERLLAERAAIEPLIAVEATGDLHRSWVSELERRHPGSVRMFAPSETRAARTQLGSARFKTDDRDCAALTYLARQGRGRRYGEESAVEALRAAVRHRRGLVTDRKIAQQRLHAQLKAVVPRSVSSSRARSSLTSGLVDGASGIGLCSRVCRSPAQVAFTAGSGCRPDDLRHRRVLGAPLAGMPAPAG